MSRRTERLALGTCLTIFLLLAGWRAQSYVLPYYDDVGYLDLGNQIRASGGPATLLRNLYGGRFLEANRHPLYIALLSLVAAPEPGYHLRARVLAIALGLLALGCCYSVARRHLGQRAALMSIGALVVSNTFVDNASKESCELLLLAVWALAIGAMLDGIRRPRRWLTAGAWAGLAYLCKGTGLLLPLCFAVALLIRKRSAALRCGAAWGFFVCFLLVASPLLVRNLIAYGSPFYNVNTRFLWADGLSDFAEVFAPNALSRLPHRAFEYLSQASVSSLLQRLGRGVAETTFHLSDAMSLVAPRSYGAVHIAWIVLGFALAICAFWRLCRAARGWARTLLLTHCAVCFAFFVCYAGVAGSSRYLLPVAAILFGILAWELGKRPGLWAPVAALVTLAGSLALFAPPPRQVPTGLVEAQRFLVEHLRPGDAFAIDSRTHLQPQWLRPDTAQIIVSPSFREAPVPAAEIVENLRRHRVRYVVLDGGARKAGVDQTSPGARRYLFYNQMPLLPDGSLPLSGFPPELKLAYVDPHKPRRFVVLESSWGATWRDGDLYQAVRFSPPRDGSLSSSNSSRRYGRETAAALVGHDDCSVSRSTTGGCERSNRTRNNHMALAASSKTLWLTFGPALGALAVCLITLDALRDWSLCRAAARGAFAIPALGLRLRASIVDEAVERASSRSHRRGLRSDARRKSGDCC